MLSLTELFLFTFSLLIVITASLRKHKPIIKPAIITSIFFLISLLMKFLEPFIGSSWWFSYLYLSGFVIGVPLLTYTILWMVFETRRLKNFKDKFSKTWYANIPKEYGDMPERLASFALQLGGFTLATLAIFIAFFKELSLIADTLAWLLLSIILILIATEVLRNARFIGEYFIGELLYFISIIIIALSFLNILITLFLVGIFIEMIKIAIIAYVGIIAYYMIETVEAFMTLIKRHKK